MKKLWSYDGLVSADHVSGKYYSEVRRDELKKIPGGDFYAAQFGIRMAAKRAAHLDVGLRLHNQYSSQYQRENRDQTFLDLCHSLYENHRNNEGGDVLPSERVFYLNSPRSAELFRKMREGRRSEDDWAEDQKKWGIVPLSEDLLAVEQKVVVREYWQDPQVDRSIHNIGGVPSIYAVLRKKFKKSLEASVQDKAVDNLETLHEVFRHHEEIRQAVARLPDAHPSKKVGSALLPLLSGLRELPDSPDFEQHTVVANSLASLSRLLPLVPSCLTDPSRLFSLYDAIVEEINLVLIAIRPYGLQDFKDAAESAFHQRTAGVTKDIEGLASAETCLMTSGMSAVAEGLHAAQAMANSSDFEGLSDWAGGMKPDYFEVPELLSSFSGQPVTGEPKAKILVTTLNPSTPQKQSAEDEAGHWDSNRMVEDVQARLKAEKLPIVLVLDTTLEKTNGIAGQSELADVMKRFKPDIESGQLKVILCKSYQKYTSLLAAKLMAGGVSVVARQDDDTQHGIDHLQRVERELNWMKNDDGQFLTHSLKYAQQDEMMLLENAAENANFIHANFFGTQGFDRFQKGVPFGVIGEPRFEVNTGGAKSRSGWNTLMLDIVEREIPHRDSFGFVESTSVVTPPEGLRISIGQESKEELVEKLYGIGWLNEKKPAVLRVDDLVAQISEDAERATSQMEAMFPFVQWADASLQVLKGRVVDKGSEEYAEILACERLLVSLVKSRRTAGSRADAAADADETRLKSDMARLYRRTGDGVGTAQLIGEQLRIVGSVFSSAMDDATRQGLDIQGMRSGVSRRSRSGDSGQNVIQTQYLPNMVASMMSLMQCVYEGEEELDDAQLKLINDLHDALLGGPLPGVSDSTRNRLLKGSFKFQCLALARKDKSEQQEGAMQILATARLFTKPEDRVEIFHRIPERLISKMDDHVKTALVDTLISPLSQELLQAYVDRLTVNKDSFPEKFKLVGSRMNAEPAPDPSGAEAPQ